MRLILGIAAALALGACSLGSLPAPPTSPGAVANTTVLDEKLAITVEGAYKAARLVIETATDAGLIRGANATKAAAIDNKAYAAVQRVRAAYRTGNAASYDAAYKEASGLIGDLLALVK